MLTLNQVRTQVSAIRKRWPNGRPVGLQVTGQWTGPTSFVLDGISHRIVQANSELGVRQALAEAAGANEGLVILSSLPGGALGEDVRARMVQPNNPFIPISSREILRELFKAKEVEPRLHGLRWMAEALVEAQPPEGFPPVPGGRLDEETAWEIFLRQVVGFRGGRPDLVEVVGWARAARSAARLRSLSPEASQALEQWLCRSAGAASGLVLAALQAAEPTSVPALALACDVLFRDDTAPELIAARGRIEQRFGGRTVVPGSGHALGQAGLRWLARESEEGGWEAVHGELEQLDQLLKQLRVESFARLSVASPLGLEQRYDAFGGGLLNVGVPPGAEQMPGLELQGAAIREHRLAAREPQRLERAQMALRLARWLLTPEPPGTPDFRSRVTAYQRDGCFVDQARHALYHGDSQPRLARAYAALLQPAAERRERQNLGFAQALVAWNEAGASGMTLVEDVIPKYVAVLARRSRVLMVVVDGLSLPIFRELMQAIGQQGLAEAAPVGLEEPEVAVAGFPTVTEWSRRLLLVGRDQAAAGVAEEAGFRNHPALTAFSAPKQAPVLFLKAALTETGGVGLSEEVRRETAGNRPVVAVVLNAVDDHLLKGDQLQVAWTLERVPLLQQLLAAAVAAGRIVVLTSDHGHVIDRDTEVSRHDAGDRFREDDAPPMAQEVPIRGGRVAPSQVRGFVAPWSERLIYTYRKNGYHGGLTPQEVLVPLAILAPEHCLPEGWQAVGARLPDWWFGPGPLPARAPVKPPPGASFPPAVQGLPLFAATSSQVAAGGPWIPALFNSERFKSQAARAGRVAPTMEVIRRVLEALDERGGVMLTPALAGRLGVPEFRLPGLLAGLRRVLNVEGYAVLSVDENSGTVRLNLDLLRAQFELE